MAPILNAKPFVALNERDIVGKRVRRLEEARCGPGRRRQESPDGPKSNSSPQYRSEQLEAAGSPRIGLFAPGVHVPASRVFADALMGASPDWRLA
jgi:hypothetical protein